MRSKLRGRRDANHDEVVNAFRELGCSVADTADLGDGFPDLVVGLIGANLLVEVKSADGSLEPGQERFRDEWRGRYDVVRSGREAAELVVSVRKAAAGAGRRA